MTRLVALRRIILPQAMRVIIPPIGNEVISMVKLTSVASVIQYAEILHNAQTIYYANARVIELLIVAAIWYLAVVTVLSIGQHFLEKHFVRGRDGGQRKRAVVVDQREGGLSHAADGGRRQIHKHFGSAARAAGCVARGRAGARCCASSARPAPARARCCAASTSWKASTAAPMWVGGELVGYRREGDASARALPDREARAQRRHRHGVPALQPVPAHDRAGKHHRGPVQVPQPGRGAAPRR
jgi:hypothetical protein